MAKNDQVVVILMKTGLNNVLLPTLFTVVNNIEQMNIVTPNSILLTTVNNVGSKTLFNLVKQRAQRFYVCSKLQQTRTNCNFYVLTICRKGCAKMSAAKHLIGLFCTSSQSGFI